MSYKQVSSSSAFLYQAGNGYPKKSSHKIFSKNGMKSWDGRKDTVCFFSFVIYYDDVNLKVVEIVNFRKKFPEGIVDTFYVI